VEVKEGDKLETCRKLKWVEKAKHMEIGKWYYCMPPTAYLNIYAVSNLI
jgi:hypothetical protein